MKRAVVLVLGPSRDAVSGVATHVRLLLEAEALTREFTLVHFQVGSEGRSERAAARWLRLAASPWRLAAEILRRDAAIVHLNSSLDRRAYWRDIAYAAVARLCGARVLFQVHGGALPTDFCGGGWLASACLRHTLSWPDVIVVLARREADVYRAFLPGRTVELLPNGIDCEAFAHGRPAPRTPEAALRLLHLGRLTERKGLFETLEALAQLRRQQVAAHLTVAGSGPEEARLRRRSCELGLDALVTFAGPVFGEEKVRLLSAADVLVLPSTHDEGMPYALLEGMAAGVVPVVTPVGGMTDVVTEGVHGVFVPPGEAAAIAQALAALARDRARLAAMSAACRERIAGAYSIERLAGDLRTLYAAMSAPRAPRTVL